jgi:DNA invertase Pin-like site-specific DNA recombinase
MINKPFIAYYRVSTEEQGDSGLGLAAQRRAVMDYITSNGELVEEFQDIESGASETRKGMLAAIEACKIYGATLVVKEISRISRGGYKYRQMMDEAKIDFIECSSPHDPDVVKDIKFSLAKEERKKVRQRTTDALAEIKEKINRGETHISKAGNVVTSLGSPQNLSELSRAKSIQVRKQKAKSHPNNVKAGAFIVALKESGKNFVQITEALNTAGFKTSRENDFSQVQTKRLYNRYK